MAGTKLASGAIFVYKVAAGSDVTVIDGSEADVTEADYGAYDKRIVAIHNLNGAATDALELQVGSNTAAYIFRQSASWATTGTVSPTFASSWEEDGPMIPSGTDLIAQASGEWMIVCKAV